MTKAEVTAQTHLNIAVVSLVALVAIVGFVALVMNSETAGMSVPITDGQGNTVGYSLVVDFAVDNQVKEGPVTQENMVGEVSRRTRDPTGPVRK